MVPDNLIEITSRKAKVVDSNNFTHTELGKIPADWEVVTMKDISTVRQGLQIPIKSRFKESGTGRYIYITIKYLNSQNKAIEAEYIQEPSERVICKKDDIILSRTGATGKVVTNIEGVFHNNFFLIDYKRNEINRDFLVYSLNSDRLQKEIKDRAGTTTIPDLNHGDFYSLYIAKPPLGEQKKIAEILSSVDEAIASTQAVIDQTRKVKQGLLQQLLAHDKDNKIQDNYNVTKYPLRFLDEVAKRVTGHTPNRQKPEYWDGGIKWVSLQDSAALDRVYIHQTAAEISEEGIRNSSAVKHPKGTVVLSRDAGVGKSAITTDEMAVSQHFIGWICSSELNNHYLYYWLQHMKPVFERIAIGNTIKTIGMPFFKSLKIPVPPIEIQLQIANTLLSHDQQIFSAEEELEQLNIIKRGLMQDLLTGRVRVKTSN
jgi:type I restriction enzyme S subunit